MAGALALACIEAKAQTKIGGAGAPDNSAMLEVTGGAGNNKGVLFPRLTTTQRDAIVSPATGLMIYNTTSNQLQVNTGTPAAPIWSISSGSNAWTTSGNAGTDSTTNFLGTTDTQPLIMRTNNTEKLRITTDGNVGIGVAAPTAQLQFNNSIQPRKVVLWDGGANNPNRYFGFGVLNHEFAYQVNQPGDDHVFYTGGLTDSTSIELMRIKGNGNVGIGTSTPAANLDVNGTARISSSTGTPTAITGRDTAGNIGNVTLGAGLTLSGGTLAAAATQPGWGLTGNAGTDSTIDFLGTTDAQPLIMRTNNTEKLRITTDGNIGIGVAAPTAQLQLNNALQPRKVVLWDGDPGTANPNRFFGFGVENHLMRHQVNSTADDQAFFAGATDTSTLELMRITGNGNVGIGTSTPAAKLDVNGTVRVGGSAPGNTMTSLTGRDATGNIGNITLGSGLSLNSGTVSVLTPAVQLIKGILVPNGVDVTAAVGASWLNTGATITLPANSTYVVTADMILSTVAISAPSSGFVPADQSLWVRTSFADTPTGGSSADLVGNNVLISGTISSGMRYSMLHGAVTITNATNAPKTYYYIVGQVESNGFTPTLYGIGANQWSENQIYAIPIN